MIKDIFLLIFIVLLVASLLTIIIITRKYYVREIDKKEDYIDRLRTYINLLNHWAFIKQKNKCVISYFLNKGYKNIAIYGVDKIGLLLINELQNSEINVKYCIDRQAGYTSSDIDTYSLEDELIEVDAIVVAEIAEYKDIMNDLSKRLSCPIINIEEIIYNS